MWRKPKQTTFQTQPIQPNHLSATEMGKLWATYVGNTMSIGVLKFFLKHVDDNNIKKVVQQALNISEKFVNEIKHIFNKENFPIPIGFTDDDVNLDAPRLFKDEFYLYYLQYTSKAGQSLYTIAIPLITRKDVREFFVYCLRETVKLQIELNQLLKEKDLLMNPPQIPTPENIDFIEKQSFLIGFFGEVRPLHGLEIGHLYDNINNDATSKALLIGFSQVASRERIRDYLLRGRDITNRHVEACIQKLNDSHLPAATFLDHLVTNSTVAPFSDKLMLFHKIDMFSMKIRTYANGMSLNGRRDIAAMYGRFLIDTGLFVEDGSNIMIDYGWMEKPPTAPEQY
ncbi:DUF3231 family protein [Salinibacillus xinjiangensis]|uniref:DUF3231 family protein n=1 Tax=Salinibacillus xinjiangensis TaxID=1229268 RepID=A0A6G1XAM2_9BACI|nr:DUF3231 family protein [Salinibacillus xinjiangensis]MRG87838.1 DUF3231 family protein [Salinibacillus xinjiangensis]